MTRIFTYASRYLFVVVNSGFVGAGCGGAINYNNSVKKKSKWTKKIEDTCMGCVTGWATGLVIGIFLPSLIILGPPTIYIMNRRDDKWEK